MSEAITKAVTTTKKSIWKYFGAMMMEEKDGQQAVSFTRVLGVILFVQALWVWSGFSSQADIPDSQLFTLWGLIGIKGVKDLALGFKK